MQRGEAPESGELGIVALDRRGSDAQPVAAHVRAAGDEAAARQGGDLVPAVLPDPHVGLLALSEAGELVGVRVVREGEGVDIPRHRPAGRLVGHPAPDQHAPLQRDVEGDRLERGRAGRGDEGGPGVGMALARLDEQAIGRPPGQAAQAVMSPGVGLRLDARGRDEAAPACRPCRGVSARRWAGPCPCRGWSPRSAGWARRRTRSGGGSR